VSAAKCSSSGGGPHAEIASSAVTRDREHLRRRLLAFTGLFLLLSGLLAALSFILLALAVLAVMVLAVLAIGGVWLLRRVQMRHGLQVALASTTRVFLAVKARLAEVHVRERGRRLGARARQTAAGTPDRASLLLARSIRGYALAVYWLNVQTARLLRPDGRVATLLSRSRTAAAPEAPHPLELNELGAQLRREGEHERAAEQHRVALEIARDLGDQQAEALTLNNLALALAHVGAEDAAVQHLEQALVVLRDLGDEEHQGRVIANLGLVHRRQGHREEAVSLLHEALDKLPPESTAYRQVEEELRRAS
jgi:tetratricopeptide (TPR) repeat protein